MQWCAIPGEYAGLNALICGELDLLTVDEERKLSEGVFCCSHHCKVLNIYQDGGKVQRFCMCDVVPKALEGGRRILLQNTQTTDSLTLTVPSTATEKLMQEFGKHCGQRLRMSRRVISKFSQSLGLSDCDTDAQLIKLMIDKRKMIKLMIDKRRKNRIELADDVGVLQQDISVLRETVREKKQQFARLAHEHDALHRDLKRCEREIDGKGFEEHFSPFGSTHLRNLEQELEVGLKLIVEERTISTNLQSVLEKELSQKDREYNEKRIELDATERTVAELHMKIKALQRRRKTAESNIKESRARVEACKAKDRPLLKALFLKVKEAKNVLVDHGAMLKKEHPRLLEVFQKTVNDAAIAIASRSFSLNDARESSPDRVSARKKLARKRQKGRSASPPATCRVSDHAEPAMGRSWGAVRRTRSLVPGFKAQRRSSKSPVGQFRAIAGKSKSPAAPVLQRRWGSATDVLQQYPTSEPRMRPMRRAQSAHGSFTPEPRSRDRPVLDFSLRDGSPQPDVAQSLQFE